MLDVVERARRYIAKCPPAISGQGGHDAAFHVAALLVHGFALGDGDAMTLMWEFNTRCQPPWTERELRHKLASAASAQHAQARGYLLGEGTKGTAFPHDPHPPVGHPLPLPRARDTAPPDPVAAAERWLKGFRCGEADLCAASAVVLEGEPRFDGAVLARALYAPGERVNFVTEFVEHAEKSGEIKARPMGKGVTLERDALVSRFEQAGSDSSKAGGWLRMNPVDGQGIGDANVTACRFALLESDTLPMALQLALFAKLPLPMAAILSSGGRSVHAWVRVDAADATEYRATVAGMLDLLAKFGVDGKNKNPSRLSRLPGATRVIGAVGDGVQRLLYLNPQPTGRAVL